MALDAVHAWGVRWRFSFGVDPTKSATMVFGPLRALTAVYTSAAFPLHLVQQYRYLGVVLSPTLSGALTSTFSAPAGIVSFTRPLLGALVKVSFSPSRLPFSSPDPPALQQFNLALRRWCRTFSDGPALHLLLQYGNLASVMLCTLPLGALSRFSELVCCRPRLPSPSGHCQCVPALLLCVRYVVTLVRGCSSLFVHPAPCPRGYLSWLSALVTPPVVLPRSQSSSVPCPSSQTLCHGV